MRFPSLSEASKYCCELPPKMSDIYLNGSARYSNFKTVVLHKEFSVPAADYTHSGILQDVCIIWYFTNGVLYLYNYETGATDAIPNFSSQVTHVQSFTPISGVFNPKIRFCLLVVTMTDVVLYAFDGLSIINTEFSARLPTAARCLTVSDGRIFIGGEDGKIYQATYHNIKFFGFRFLRLYTPNGILQGFRNIFKRKRAPIVDVSAGSTHLVALSNSITIYDIQSGVRRRAEIALDREYARIQIIEDTPLMVCCVSSDGSRDFYTDKGRFLHKDIPIAEQASSLVNPASSEPSSPLILSAGTHLFFHQRSSSSRTGLTSFNSYHLRNFSRIRPVENFELLPFYIPIHSAALSSSKIYLLSDSKITVFNILDAERLIITCKPQEIRELYSCYGDIEFMVKYYDLASSGEDVSKMSGLCQNVNIKNYALFIFMYSLIDPVFKVDLSLCKADLAVSHSPVPTATGDIPGQFSSGKLKTLDINMFLDNITARMKLLKAHVPAELTEARNFIDELIQTRYYISLLNNYGVPFSETLESILTRESNFRTETLNALLSTVSVSQDVDPLLRTMKNKCPLYLPYSEINMRRGMDILRRGEGAFLQQSLEYFLKADFDKAVVQRYNELGYYYGSVMIIRKKPVFSYETDTALLKESVKCRKSVEAGLQDMREAFLYPFFEALVALEQYLPCRCCANSDTSIDLMRIDNPFFEVFLKDLDARNIVASNPKTYNLYWKYLLARGKKVEAVEAILSLVSRPELRFSGKIELLEQALTISACCDRRDGNLRARIKQMLRLAEIQSELMARDPSTGTVQLLSADELFNDYCLDHLDLKIRILDVVGNMDAALLRNLFEKYLEATPLSVAVKFISSLSNSLLPIVIDLILQAKPEEDLAFRLREAGFARDAILGAIQSAISGSSACSKDMLWRCLENFADPSELENIKSCCSSL